MGQYFKVFNFDKKQCLSPYAFNDGAKFLEFAQSSPGVLTGLAYLLRQSSGTGGGDTSVSDPLIGSWAGDRIAIVGDYDKSGIYKDTSFVDISQAVVDIMNREE